MDGGFQLDPEELREMVKEVEIVSVLFPLIRRSLIIDFRCTASEGPMVRLMPQAISLDERLRSIRRVRPAFPRPNKIAAFPWPKYANSLTKTEAFATIHSRLESLGFARTTERLFEALEQIRRLERKELTDVLQGDRYHVIWSNSM